MSKDLGLKITETEYRTNPAISRSELWKISESPEKFRYYKDFPQEPTDALLFGQAFHKMALEPETFYDEFDFAPDVDRRTSVGKEVYAEWAAQAEGKTIVPRPMMQQIGCMCEALKNDTYAAKLLTGQKERSFFWTDADTGEPCKCRTDNLYLGKKGLLIVDLKSCADASYEAFSRDVFKYGYDFQAAMYSEGVKAVTNMDATFVFVAVEKKPPYAINIFYVDDAVREHGYDTFRTLLGIYHDCKLTDNWYGHMGKEHMISTIILPPWLGGNDDNE